MLKKALMVLLVFFVLNAWCLAKPPQIVWLPAPPWVECPKPGACFNMGNEGDFTFFGMIDSDQEMLIIGPVDMSKYMGHLTPSGVIKDHVSNEKAPLYYCKGEGCRAAWTECPWPLEPECIKSKGSIAGTGAMTQGTFTLLYDAAHGWWWQGCPAVWTVHGTVFDNQGKEFKVTSSWHYVPSPNEPEFCTEDNAYCWPCKTKSLEVEISPQPEAEASAGK